MDGDESPVAMDSVSRHLEVRLGQTLHGQVTQMQNLLTSVKQTQLLELWVLLMSETNIKEKKTDKGLGVVKT